MDEEATIISPPGLVQHSISIRQILDGGSFGSEGMNAMDAADSFLARIDRIPSRLHRNDSKYVDKGCGDVARIGFDEKYRNDREGQEISIQNALKSSCSITAFSGRQVAQLVLYAILENKPVLLLSVPCKPGLGPLFIFLLPMYMAAIAILAARAETTTVAIVPAVELMKLEYRFRLRPRWHHCWIYRTSQYWNRNICRHRRSHHFYLSHRNSLVLVFYGISTSETRL